MNYTAESLSVFGCYGCISSELSVLPEFRGIWCKRNKKYMMYESNDALIDWGKCKLYSTGEVRWDIRAIS